MCKQLRETRLISDKFAKVYMIFYHELVAGDHLTRSVRDKALYDN